MVRRIMAFDPSINKTGYACFDYEGLNLHRVVEVEFFEQKTEPDEDEKGSRKTRCAYRRMDGLITDTWETLNDHREKVDHIAVEVTTGKTSSRHGGRGAGLAIYGVAVAAVLITCERWAKEIRRQRGSAYPKVHRIYENDWTAGSSKAGRQAWMMSICPSYDPAADKKMDLSDAAYLCEWTNAQIESGAIRF